MLDNSTNFHGEVIQLDGEIDYANSSMIQGFWWNKMNLGFNSLLILFQLPPVSGARGIVLPVFADRR
jgi:hypothetical protein